MAGDEPRIRGSRPVRWTMTSTRATTDAARNRWEGPAWWALVAAGTVLGGITTFFFSFYLLAWLMATVDLVTDPVGTAHEVFRPGGVASQIGWQSVGCLLVLALVAGVLTRAYRARHGLGGRDGVGRLLLVLWTAAVTIVGGAWTVLFVAFSKLDLADDVARVGVMRGLVGPVLVLVVIVVVVVLSWRRLLRGRRAA